jgi:hypothetical protein
MTLTMELADPESPASRLLRDSFPARDAIVAVWNAQVQRLPPVVTGLDGGVRTAVGGAIEWAIGLDLADTVPYADVFDTVAREEAHVSYRPPVSNQPSEALPSAGSGCGDDRRPGCRLSPPQTFFVTPGCSASTQAFCDGCETQTQSSCGSPITCG